jgi:hypothetical protein
VLTTPHRKNVSVTKHSDRKPRAWADILVRTKQQKWDTRFGVWSVRSLYRAGSLTAAAATELARNKLDLVGVQEVRWDKEARKSREL